MENGVNGHIVRILYGTTRYGRKGNMKMPKVAMERGGKEGLGKFYS